MKTVKRAGVVATLAVVCILNAAAVYADEQSFYESLPEVTIGKIFFSPLQRKRLDQVRGSSDAPGIAASSKSKSGPRKNNKDAAGFIISSKGVSRVYTNGEFVTAKPGDSVRFPGTVNVILVKDTEERETRDAAN